MKVNRKRLLDLPSLMYTGILSAVIVFGFSAFYNPPSQAAVTLDDQEREFIKNINNYRESKNLNPIKISTKLSKAAAAMAQDMADNPSTINHEHKDSQGRLPAERAALFGYTDGVGENLAAGYETADKVFEAWKGSEEHKANMVDKDYEVMGVARVTTNNNYKWYWVNMFGTVKHSSDLMNENDYSPMLKIQVVVTGPEGKPINKAQISILNKNKHKITGAKSSTKGKRSFSVAPNNEFYVRASAKGYKFYVKRVKPGSKNDITVKMWLEKG